MIYIHHIHHKGVDIFFEPATGRLRIAEPMTTAADNRKRPPFSTLRMEWMFNKPFDQSGESLQTRHR